MQAKKSKKRIYTFFYQDTIKEKQQEIYAGTPDALVVPTILLGVRTSEESDAVFHAMVDAAKEGK